MWADQPIQDWIDAVCRQYSRIMGRALTFDPLAAAAGGALAGIDTGEHWRAAISDGTQTVGVLRLKSRIGHERDAEFLRACEAAELTAQLIERVIVTRGPDDLIPSEPRRPGPVCYESPQTSNVTFSTRPAETPAGPRRIDRLLDALRRLTGFPAAALFVRGTNEGVQQLCALRSTDAVNLAAESLEACLEGLEDDRGEDRVAVYRRYVEPQTPFPFLPPGVATGVAYRVGSANCPEGSLWMFDRRDRRLTHRDRHMLRLVSERLEPLIEHAALLDERSNSRLLNAEVRVASRTQPSAPVEYTGRAGWCEIAGCTQTTRGIGGDLFELIPLTDGRVFLAIGDAAGHSIPAALVMASVRGALRALFEGASHGEGGPSGLPPQEILQRVNAVLHGIVQSHQFMTMFCGVLDGRTMTLEYANAGHPQPLLLREDRVELLSAHGLVLGVTDDATYDRAAVSLQAGDVFVFYTDGVTEAACRERNLFGSDRIEDIVRVHAAHGAVAMRDELWAALQVHLTGSGQHDDRTLAVLRVAGDIPHAP